MEGFLHSSLGLSSITKRDFFRLFWPAWNKAVSPKNIESAWRSVGIQPWDTQVVLQKFIDKDAERPSSSESSRSILGAEDWRRIEKLLKRVVTDVYDQNIKKLSSTMHHLATQNIILKLRCDGLENALENKKKKWQRAKPLLFELWAPEDGYAVFYSLKKIQQAQELQQQKDKAIQAAKALKEEGKLRQIHKKEEKKRQVKERRRIQAFNKEQRLRLAEEKKQQKEEARIAKEAEKQLQNSFKTAQKGKKTTLETPKPKNIK